ncbi:MAG: enoyl-CoA hydratase/isomerase family protein [Deltaproteobacteria bacterium]|nr:enoyl-CoA hydratase/isomerase family protein [Deltaproteobacteria bacterium]
MRDCARCAARRPASCRERRGRAGHRPPRTRGPAGTAGSRPSARAHRCSRAARRARDRRGRRRRRCRRRGRAWSVASCLLRGRKRSRAAALSRERAGRAGYHAKRSLRHAPRLGQTPAVPPSQRSHGRLDTLRRPSQEDLVPDLVLSERRGAALLLTLNRPDALNALSSALLTDLAARLDEVARDGSARALVITGAGRAFAAGADIAQMRTMTPQQGEAFSRLGHDTFAKLEALAIPTIAAVNGFALGGGCELALACDWIYASKKARLGQPEVNLGLIPGFGGTSRLVRRVGPAWAKELILTGEPIDADTALRIGLANRVYDDAEPLLAAALATAETIAKKGPVAVASAKRVMQEGQDADVRVAHALEQVGFGSIFATEDRLEGMDAFLGKRTASFSGK